MKKVSCEIEGGRAIQVNARRLVIAGWAGRDPAEVEHHIRELEAIGVRVMRADTPDDLCEIVAAAAALAFESEQQVAVLISQRLIGRKKW